tara:strand:- start:634 stop:2406 length:1773 start_codon:yes stop_codon:yes gene_type:complete
MITAPYKNKASIPGTTGVGNISPGLATNPLAGAAKGLEQISGQLAAAGERVQKREDVINRGRDEDTFKTNVSTEWQRVQDQEDLTDRATFQKFNAYVETQKATLINNHRGSLNSNTLLDRGLSDLAGGYERAAISATREAQIGDLTRQFGDKANVLISGVASGEMDVNEAFVKIKEFTVGDDTPGGALPTYQELQLVDALQSQLVILSISQKLDGTESGITQAKALLEQNPSFERILSSDQLGKVVKKINDQETAINIADIKTAQARQAFARDAGYNNYSEVPADIKLAYASDGKILPKVTTPYEMKSVEGKRIQDRAFLVEKYGETDPSVQAFDELTSKTKENSKPTSKIGKLIADGQSLLDQGVKQDDPRIKAIEKQINQLDPEHLADVDRGKKFVPADIAFKKFNTQALSLQRDAKKALMYLTNQKTFKAAERDAMNKDFGATVTGITSLGSRFYPGSDYKELESILTRLGGSALINALAELKAASPTGASGMGALNETEGNALRFQEGALSISAPETLAQTLLDIVNSTDSSINTQIRAMKSSFPTRAKELTAKFSSDSGGEIRRYTNTDLRGLSGQPPINVGKPN